MRDIVCIGDACTDAEPSPSIIGITIARAGRVDWRLLVSLLAI